MYNLKNFGRKLRTNEKGNVLILMGLCMPLLVGLAGLGTDTIQWTLTKQQLQRSADSAALNGAYAKAQSKNVSSNANADLTKTLDEFTGVGITVENAPVAGAFAGNTRAVKVILTYSKALPFSSMFLSTPPLVKVEAVAAVLNNGDYCVISLEDTNSTGVVFTGNSTVDLGCGVASNSTGPSAVTADGSTNVTASPVAAVGNVPASPNYGSGTQLIPYSIPQRDPFEALTDPSADLPVLCTGNLLTVGSSENLTIEPGCFTGINVRGTLTMKPGTYYIKGGDFETNAQSVITAHGVTIVLTGGGTSIGQVKMNGGADIDMSAPTSGPFKNVLFYKDRDAPASYNDVFNGGASGSFLGAIYMPSQTVTLNGNSTFTTDCLQIVSRKVVVTGNTTITNECPVGGGGDTFVGTQVRLVG
ncbi:MAG: pilus assembly protein TadG-related protein [Pseudomonadota bacterium]